MPTRPFFSGRIEPKLYELVEGYRQKQGLTRTEMLELALQLLVSEEHPEYYPDKLLLKVNHQNRAIATALQEMGGNSLRASTISALREISEEEDPGRHVNN